MLDLYENIMANKTHKVLTLVEHHLVGKRKQTINKEITEYLCCVRSPVKERIREVAKREQRSEGPLCIA